VLTEVAGDGAVGGLGLERLAVGSDEDGGHETEGAEALGDNVGLDVTIVVWSMLAGKAECEYKLGRTLHGDDVAALALDHLGDHVVNEAVLVPDASSIKVLLVLALVDLLEDILELAVVGLEDSVLGAHVQRQLLVEGKLEGRVGEAADGLGCVVLCLGDTTAGGEVVDLDGLGLAALGGEDHLEGTLALDDAVLCAVLVAKGVTADDDGLLPAGYEAGDTGDDNGSAEDGATEVVADGAVGREPHLLELELLDALLVGRDGGALDTDRVLLDGLCSIEGDLVVCLVAVGQAEVIVLEVNVEVGVDELVLDGLPDDARHLVAIELDDRVDDLDLVEAACGRHPDGGAGRAGDD
jgi:hypothetical protein